MPVTVRGDLGKRWSVPFLGSFDWLHNGPIPCRPRPDPIVGRADGIDPEHEALVADSVGLTLQNGRITTMDILLDPAHLDLTAFDSRP